MTINERLEALEQKIIELTNKTDPLLKEAGRTDKPATTTHGGSRITMVSHPIGARSGRGAISGGQIIWNDAEVDAKLGTQPREPGIGYNKHTHSRYSGGALIKDVLEIVEFDYTDFAEDFNKHSQGFLTPGGEPPIKKEVNAVGESVEKIGLLDLVFNVDSGTWGVASYEIDVKKCYLVERETEGDNKGEIKKDSKDQEMKSPLWNEDQTKTSVIWDENARVWRFLAVYASGED